ncbi:NAD(+) synthase [Pseudoramibacter faecis]|uniref:NAD(+) synthase n=1 Tax=Pseudoramibacter faecis TaxID=3108534 RepID=UPI002E764DE0|nr:NAD(+) synthase [Pseudoramibacter sp. HA2172]
MKAYGMVRTALAIPEIRVADPAANTAAMMALGEKAAAAGVGILLFPELAVTGYTCGDLFAQSALLAGGEAGLAALAEWSQAAKVLVVVGAPIPVGSALYNCGVAMNRGRILGAVPKTYIPNTHEFYEKRWFAASRQLQENWVTHAGQTFPIGTDLLFVDQDDASVAVGLEICEDLWAPAPPSGELAAAGATLVLNPSASNELTGKSEYRKDLVVQQSARCNAAYLYASCGIGESTTDLVFGGEGLIVEKGRVLAQSERFVREGRLIVADVDVEALVHDRQTQSSFADAGPAKPYRRVAFCCQEAKDWRRPVNPAPFVPADPAKRTARCEEIFAIQSVGLMSRIHHIGDCPMVLGISGGLDSTLALLVCAEACDRLGLPHSAIHAVTMPGFGTTDRTYDNAVALIRGLGATFHEIGISRAAAEHLADIGHDLAVHDVTYENAQARERTQILMDLANQVGGIVVGTGDLSELALGWATYSGDHMSMYGVNAGVPKTLVRYLVATVADQARFAGIRQILMDVLDTPVSPELLPPDAAGKIAQKTEDLVGPYALHDFFLYHVVRNGFSPKKVDRLARAAFAGTYDAAVIRKWLRHFYRRFFAQQFKRSCLPDGPKVGTVALSPRGDWRMPSDAKASLWIAEVEAL